MNSPNSTWIKNCYCNTEHTKEDHDTPDGHCKRCGPVGSSECCYAFRERGPVAVS